MRDVGRGICAVVGFIGEVIWYAILGALIAMTWPVSIPLLILYLVIKAAVRNGSIEAREDDQ